MKKASRILLIILLIGLLATVFSACSALSKFQYSSPDKVDGKGSSSDNYDEKYPMYLSFTYLTQSPSIFKSIYIDEFKLENIQYQVMYYVKKESSSGVYEDTIPLEDPKPLTEDMLDQTSLENLKVAGHHTIFVSTKATDSEGIETTVNGSFPLHLKSRSALEFVTLTFNLNGGNALFGSTENDVATIKVVKGTSYSASEFFSNFNAVKEGFALAEWAGFSGNIKANADATFTAKWTSDLIKVSFDLNLPDGVIGKSNTYTSEPIKPAMQNVQKNKGFVSRPSSETFATLTGYSFVGWFKSKTGGEIWNFNECVGENDFTLYARWEVRTCSVTYILMGGVFDENKPDVVATKKVDGTILYINGDSDGDQNLTSNLMVNNPFMFTISGMTYNTSYSDYYAEFAPVKGSENIGYKVTASPQRLKAQLKKGDNYYEISDWYESPSYEEESKYTSDKVSGNIVLYARWEVEEEILEHPESEIGDKYFSEYLYNYTVKADGTVRIDMVRDSAISTLVIPEKIDGKYVTEFGAQAGMNLKSLVSVDASRATNLKTIGKQAFYNSYSLENVSVASNIEYIGEDAFKGTKWLDEQQDSGFAVLGSVLIKCFDFESETINVDTETLPELSNVTIIAGGAFKDNYKIKSVTIGAGIKQIDNGAFSNCKNLSVVDGAENVEKVGENAFNGTEFVLSTKDPERKFIQIGKVYYKNLSNTKEVVIPEVEYIAAHAFAGTSNVEIISFENASKIINVGEGAFSGTLWLSKDRDETSTGDVNTYIKDGFIVVNNVLVGFTKRVVNNDEPNWSVAFVPSGVTTIASHAFSGYSNAKLTNIVIPESVTTIESEAFYGATSLVGISFIGTGENSLATIQDDTFSGADGGLVSKNLKIYLYQAVLAKVKNPSTAVWNSLYTNNNALFEELKTSNVEINANVVPTVYICDGVGNESFFRTEWNKIGILAAENNIMDGVIVTRNDGITNIENLPIGSFNFGTTGVFKINYVGCTNNTYTYITYPSIDTTSIELWKNNVKVTTPLEFYSTQSQFVTEGLELRFKYSTGGAPIKVALDNSDATSGIKVSYSGYTQTLSDAKELTITIDYHGLATYDKKVPYITKKPVDESIEQVSSLVIPLNADAKVYFSSVQLLVTKQDKSQRIDYLSNAKVISSEDYNNLEERATADVFNLDTTSIGDKTAGVRYGNDGNFIYCVLTYSVILKADETQFYYRIDNNADHQAYITGSKSAEKNTITLPTTVSLNSKAVVSNIDSEQYTIVGIDNNAFKDKKSLEYIYLSETITSIGDDAFSGCTSLKNVYVFKEADGEDSFGESIEKFSSNVVSIGDRAFYGCTALENLDLSQATALAEIGSFAFYGCSSMTEIDLSKTKVVDISDYMFGECSGLKKVTLYAYTTTIGNGAFYNCYNLETINGYQTDKITYIGDFAFQGCTKLQGLSLSINGPLAG